MAVAKMKSKTKRARKPKVDSTPSWEGSESLSSAEYAHHFRNSMQYYNLNFSGKELKPKVIDWLTANKVNKKTIKAFKLTADWRVSATMGAIAANLLNGMPEVRDDFNNGNDVGTWLKKAVNDVIEAGANDNPPKKTENKEKQAINIQARLREAALKKAEELDDAYNAIIANPTKYDIKSFKALNILRTAEAKAAHARIIRTFYEKDLEEMAELVAGTKCEQLKEAYSHLNKSQIKKIYTLLKEIDGACDMVIKEGKVARSPRKAKPKSKDKLIEKLNYKKSDETLKLVSINPADIIGATELWVYNIKTRKLGKYIAENIDPKNLGRDGTGLSIKGTTIIGFNEKESIQKTLRKPLEQLPEFMKMGKVKLRTYLSGIKAVDIKLNGRINPDILLLKVTK